MGKTIDALGLVAIGGLLLWLVLSLAQPSGLNTPVVAHGTLEGKPLVVGDYVPLVLVLGGFLLIHGRQCSLLTALITIGLLIATIVIFTNMPYFPGGTG